MSSDGTKITRVIHTGDGQPLCGQQYGVISGVHHDGFITFADLLGSSLERGDTELCAECEAAWRQGDDSADAETAAEEDPELVAIRSVSTAIEDLPLSVRRRILTWAQDRYATSPLSQIGRNL